MTFFKCKSERAVKQKLLITNVGEPEYVNFPSAVQHGVKLNSLHSAISKQISCVQDRLIITISPIGPKGGKHTKNSVINKVIAVSAVVSQYAEKPRDNLSLIENLEKHKDSVVSFFQCGLNLHQDEITNPMLLILLS